MTAPLILLHGYWHGSWCFAPLTSALAARGRAAVAVDMAGHGLKATWPPVQFARPFDDIAYASQVSPMASVTLEQAGEELLADVRRIGGGDRTTVVAHSMGGAVLTYAAQQAPDLFERLVYLTAFMPVVGLPAAAYIQSPENHGELVGPSLRADPAAVACLRFDTGSPDPTYQQQLREAFYNDVAQDVANAAIHLLCPDAPIGIAAGVVECTADGWGSIPRTYIVCTMDNAIKEPLQRRFIGEADNAFPAHRTEVVELTSSHSPFLSMPSVLADVLA